MVSLSHHIETTFPGAKVGITGNVVLVKDRDGLRFSAWPVALGPVPDIARLQNEADNQPDIVTPSLEDRLSAIEKRAAELTPDEEEPPWWRRALNFVTFRNP